MPNNITDTSSALHVYRYGHGFKLLKPNQIKHIKPHKRCYDTGHSVDTLLKLPFCVYFLDTESKGISMNEKTVEESGFNSLNHALGRTISEVLTPESAASVIKKDRDVLAKQQIKTIEETCLRKDDISFSTLSIKCPWYNFENKLIGIMGYTIVLGTQPLIESLQQISKLGVFNNENTILPGLTIDNIYLTKREIECLQLTIKGKSAKKVAIAMGISHRTVEEHLSNIKFKMNVNSKSELIEKVIDTFK